MKKKQRKIRIPWHDYFFSFLVSCDYRHCQTLTVWSTLPVATTGLMWQYLQDMSVSMHRYQLKLDEDPYDMQVTKWSCASKVFVQRPVLRSHILIVLSSEALNRYFPLGCTTRPRTQLSCPINVCKSCPLLSQILMVLSLDPVITYRPGTLWSLFLLWEKHKDQSSFAAAQVSKNNTYFVAYKFLDVLIGVTRYENRTFYDVVVTSQLGFRFSRLYVPDARSLHWIIIRFDAMLLLFPALPGH